MTDMTTQTEAQRLAAALASTRRWNELTDDDCDKAATELLRFEAANAELLEALKCISEGFRILKDSDFPALAIARAAIKKHGGQS